jgi:hypothetical protein
LRRAFPEGSSAAGTPVANVFVTNLVSELAVAARHVAQGRMIVARQRERIARLKAQGLSTLDHEQTLDVFVSTLQILEQHERALRSSAEKLAAKRRLLAH